MKIKIIRRIIFIPLAIFLALIIHYGQVKALEKEEANLNDNLITLTNEVEEARIKSLTMDEWSSSINELENKNDEIEKKISEYQEQIEEQEEINQEIKDTMD